MAASISRCLLALIALGVGSAEARAEEDAPAPLPTDEELLASQGAVIEIWDERPDKPFDRDTELRLTGVELAERGATDLADALALVPELYVREAGRGGRQIDIRGARKGSLKILIDGVSVDDPFYGNFDLSSIPVTDIVEIRVSASPASPIDGAGGPGGVIEVHTRDAVGGRRLEARVQGSSLPAAEGSVTGRAALGRGWAMRASTTATLGARDFDMGDSGGEALTLDEDRRGAAGGLRLEYRRGSRRLLADAWAQHRSFLVPPGEDGASSVLDIQGETAGRVSLRAEDQLSGWRLEGRGYLHLLARDSIYYGDATLTEVTAREDLGADRAGGALLVNRPLGKRLHVIGTAVVDSESAAVRDMDGTETGGRATLTELAAGLQYEDGPWRADLAGGLAVPLGLGADPWPEGKLAVRLQPRRAPTALKLTLGRKGRVPTLRERFRLDIGNAALGPEKVSFAELAVEVAPARAVTFTAASWVRQTSGLIRFDAARAELVNTGDLALRGIDARVQLAPAGPLGAGGSWSYTDAHSALLGAEPLDFLPHHRADGWLSARRGDRLGGTLRVAWIGSQIDRNARLPAFASAELGLFARLGRRITGTARVGNLADADYQLRMGVPGPGRTVALAVQGVWE